MKASKLLGRRMSVPLLAGPADPVYWVELNIIRKQVTGEEVARSAGTSAALGIARRVYQRELWQTNGQGSYVLYVDPEWVLFWHRRGMPWRFLQPENRFVVHENRLHA